MNDVTSALSEATRTAQDVNGLLENVSGIFASFALILESVISLFGIWIFIIAAILSIIITIAFYFAKSIPVYALAKKVGCKQAWFAWIPFFHDIFCLIVLSRISGKEEFQLGNGKLKTKNSLVILGYVLFAYCGSIIITILIGIVNVIPVVGQVATLIMSLLYLLPGIYKAVVEFVYFRDTLDTYKPDPEKNRIHALIVILLDAFLTGGLALTCYLWSMLKLRPLSGATIQEDMR